jgi:Ni,Fe-hydrogenase I cytochrome b subunit
MGTLSSGPICFGLRSVNRDLFIWCFVLSLMLMGWGGFYLASTRLTKNRSDDLNQGFLLEMISPFLFATGLILMLVAAIVYFLA